MRILFLDQFNELGGAQQCLIDLVEGMPDHDLHAAIPGSGPLTCALRDRGVLVYDLPRLHYSNGRKSPADIIRFAFDAPLLSSYVREIVEAHGIELVYVNGPRLLPAAARVSSRIVFHAHSYLNKGYARAIARWCLRRRDARAIACCDFVARAFDSRGSSAQPARWQAKPPAPPCGANGARGGTGFSLSEFCGGPLAAAKTTVIYNGVRELPFRPPWPADGRAWRVGVVGRIAPEKGQVDFVRAARILTERNVNARFEVHGAPLFSGSGYERRVRKLATGLPVAFAGWSSDVAKVFSGLDILAVPSAAIEATSRVILEAFSAGVAVVAYPSGGIPEVISNGVTGVLTASPEPAALADAIDKLIRDPRRMISIALAARRSWEQRFTVERYVREIREFLYAGQDTRAAAGVRIRLNVT